MRVQLTSAGGQPAVKRRVGGAAHLEVSQVSKVERIQCTVACELAQEASQRVDGVHLLGQLASAALSGRSKRQSKQCAWKMPLSTRTAHRTRVSILTGGGGRQWGADVSSARTSILKPKTRYGSYWFGKGFDAANSLIVPGDCGSKYMMFQPLTTDGSSVK